MDSVDIAERILTVLQLTTNLVEHLIGVKNKSNDQKQCTIEASDLFALLIRLKFCLGVAGPTGPLHAKARGLTAAGGRLDQYEAALGFLMTEIVPKSGAKKEVAACLWQFTKLQTEEILGTIEQLKTTLINDLQIDPFKLSQSIEETETVSTAARRRQDERLSQIIVDWLSPIDYFVQQIDLASLQKEGTGMWFLGSREYNSWIEGGNITLFFPGITGTDKTMIPSLVITHLFETKDCRDTGVVFIYCSYEDDKRRKVVDLFSALLRQLVEALPHAPAVVQELYETHQRAKTRPSIDEISTAIRGIFEDYKEISIVFGALDEYPERYRNDLLSNLNNIQVPRVRLMVTSRRNRMFGTKNFETALQLPMKAHSEDIKLLMDSQIQYLPACVGNNEELKLHFTLAIYDVAVADGMYLLAPPVVDILMDKCDPKSVEDALQNILRGPEALYEMYQDAIMRIERAPPEHRDLAKTALSWVTYAKRPLSVKELQHALATEIGDRQFNENKIIDMSVIITRCAGLVTMDRGSDVVRLAHYTAHEFFEEMGCYLFPAAEEKLARVCISYLSFDFFKIGACRDEDELARQLRPYPLYNYAAMHWGDHTRIACIEEDPLLLEFLDNDPQVSAPAQVTMSLDENNSISMGMESRQITEIHLAAYFGLENTITTLLRTCHDPHCPDANGRTPIFYAAMNGHDGVVKQLLVMTKADPEIRDTLEQTLLSYAADLGQATVVKLLLARDDVDPNSKDYRNLTPLSNAAKNGHGEVVEILLANKNVNPNSTCHFGQTPLAYAVCNRRKAAVKLLLMDTRVDLNSMDDYGYTPLLYASSSNKDVVELLLENPRVEPDIKSPDGRTPLSYAAGSGQEAIVKLLLGIGVVDPNSEDNTGRTPLSYAAEQGSSAVVKLLLEEPRVDPEAMDNTGRTPLSWAASWSRRTESSTVAVAQVLLADIRIDPDFKDSRGRTPLSYAAECGHGELVKLLVADDRVDPFSKDVNGVTPLLHAERGRSRKEVVALLGDSYINLDSQHTNGLMLLL